MQDDKRQTWIIVVLVSILLLGGTAVGLLVVPRVSQPEMSADAVAAEPQPDPANPNEYVASADFQQKPLVEQMKYMRENRERLDRRVMGRLWRKRMQETMDKWYELPEDQRVAYLDQLIDDWEEVAEYWREQREQEEEAEQSDEDDEDGEGEASRNDENRGRGRWGRASRGEMREHIRDRTESTSPEQRAKQRAFFTALMKRRAERGLPGWGRGGRGRPH